MAEKRKICVVTGTRAEYGLLYWLMKEIEADPDLKLQIIATGMHLSPEFGLTYRVIEQDGFTIDAKVEMLLSSDTPVGIAKSIGLGVIGFADALDRLKPDILVVLGDRYESFAAAQAAMIARIPIAHIAGGEATEGLIDEPIRHAITKLAQFHFAEAEPYRRRIIQMGESPDRVWNYGALGLENFKRIKLLDRRSFEKQINFDLGELSFLVTYHPVTLSSEDPRIPFSNLLKALDFFKTAKIIFTKSNSDTAGRIINALIDEYALKHPENVKTFISMGQLLYLSALHHVNVVIGNSSSGIVEAPFVPVPTVNIGDRQKGRLKATSIIDCSENCEEIVSAIQKAVSREFKQILNNTVSYYGKGDTSLLIKNKLKEIKLEGVIMKHFYNIEALS